MSSHIDVALAGLEAERAQLHARLALVENALAALKPFACDNDATPVIVPDKPGPRPTRPYVKKAPETTAPAPASTRGGQQQRADRILELLTAHGPMTPGALAKDLDIALMTLRRDMTDLQSDGKVRCEGLTARKQWMLTSHTSTAATSAAPDDVTDEAVLDTLRRLGGMATLMEVAKRLNVSRELVRPVLSRLRVNEVIGRTGDTFSLKERVQ